MSVDSQRMLKLETEVKELKTYIDKLVGSAKSESNNSIESLKKSVAQIDVFNKHSMQDKKDPTIDVESKVKSIVTKDYINAIYRNK
jgi:ElaB/YqjD/DUF883 family membrane-anchored ribosome-binding protein